MSYSTAKTIRVTAAADAMTGDDWRRAWELTAEISDRLAARLQLPDLSRLQRARVLGLT